MTMNATPFYHAWTTLKTSMMKKWRPKEQQKSSFNAAVNDNTDKDGTDEAIEEMLMANPHLQPILAPFVTHAYH